MINHESRKNTTDTTYCKTYCNTYCNHLQPIISLFGNPHAKSLQPGPSVDLWSRRRRAQQCAVAQVVLPWWWVDRRSQTIHSYLYEKLQSTELSRWIYVFCHVSIIIVIAFYHCVSSLPCLLFQFIIYVSIGVIMTTVSSFSCWPFWFVIHLWCCLFLSCLPFWFLETYNLYYMLHSLVVVTIV